MRDFKELKNLTNEKLSSCWCESILIVMISFSIVAVLASFCVFMIYLLNMLGVIEYDYPTFFFHLTPLQLLIIILYTFLCSFALFPLRHGVNWFYYQAVMRKTPEIFSIFSCYSSKAHLSKITLLNVALIIKKSIVAVPLLVLTFIEVFGYIKVCEVNDNAYFSILFLICALVLVSINISLYILYSSKYFLVNHIYSVNPTLSVRKIIALSVTIMKKNKGYIFAVIVKFLPYILSCALFIPVVFVIPYITMLFTIVKDDFMLDYYDEKLRNTPET